MIYLNAPTDTKIISAMTLLGHIPKEDPTFSGKQRFTCSRGVCGATVIDLGYHAYGSGLTDACRYRPIRPKSCECVECKPPRAQEGC